MERRTFLSAGSASVLAFAAGYPFTSDAAASDGPDDVVREYYRRAGAAETVTEFADQVPDLAHSVSPLLDVATDIPRTFDGALRQQLVDVEVVEEDIGGEEIRDWSDFFAESVTEDELRTIAETNAVVAVTLETEEVIGGEFAKEWLVAPEDGEWRLVWFGESEGPEVAVREFFRQAKGAESLGALDRALAERSHSDSPILNLTQYAPWYFRGLRRQELVRTEVAAEDVDVGEIASEFTPFVSWTSRDEIRAIAERNAVVAVSLSDDQLGVEGFTRSWLVAPEYGEWRVVWV